MVYSECNLVCHFTTDFREGEAPAELRLGKILARREPRRLALPVLKLVLCLRFTFAFWLRKLFDPLKTFADINGIGRLWR